LSYFTGLYTAARQDYLALFRKLDAEGVREIVFCGVDEVAEIAFLSLMETSIRLAEVIDEVDNGVFFGNIISPLNQVLNMPVVITSLKRREHLKKQLLRLGIMEINILTIRE